MEVFYCITGLLVFLNVLINGQNDGDIVFPDDNTKYEFSPCETSDGYPGECRKVSDCLLSNLNFESFDLCSFIRDEPLYCCPRSNLALITPKENKELQNLRPALQICELYHPSHKSLDILLTGVGRSLAQKHPHMAAIGWTSDEGNVDWKCGGSVVTAKFILTAAHCTIIGGVQPDIARTGDQNLLVTENNTEPIDFNITDVHVHPDYNPSAMYHDIALLKIFPNFQVTLTNRPACLWTDFDIPDEDFTGLGYGTLEFSRPRSNELFEGTLQSLSQKDCSTEIPSNPNVPSGIITGQFCARDPNHIKDTCQGDSGGPLQFYNRSESSERPLIVGITSFAQYCANNSPGVYTRVSAYLDWLEPILMSNF